VRATVADGIVTIASASAGLAASGAAVVRGQIHAFALVRSGSATTERANTEVDLPRTIRPGLFVGGL
jgi:hypothetical protein